MEDSSMDKSGLPETEIKLLDVQKDSFSNSSDLRETDKEKDESGKRRDGEKKREHWTRQMDFFLSIVGYTVGVGNLWRFPYVCNRNGGGAFLIPFVICLFACGAPLYLLELTLGQFSGKGALQVWDICPLFRGLGWASNIVSALCSWYFIMLLAWPLYYLFASMSPVLPYSTCGNPWNTPHCVSRHVTSANVTWMRNATQEGGFHGDNVTRFAVNVTEFAHGNVSTVGVNVTSSSDGGPTTPFEEYWTRNVLGLSGGLEDMGGVRWQLLLCLLATWAIIAVCILKGVKTLGKVVYVTAVAPYLLLTVLLIRALTLDGAVDGVIYYLKPDFAKLLQTQVWVEAAVQVFYSLGPGWGGLITMSSYSRFNNNLYRDALLLPVISEGTSFYGGLVVFSVLGYMAKTLNVPIGHFVTSGPGLGLVVYPEALSTLPLPQLWAVLFFLMILLVGLDTQFAMVETVITTIVDAFPRTLGRRRWLTTIVCCVIFFLISIPYVCDGGMYLYVLVDWYMAALGLFIITIMECVIVGWIYGGERMKRDMELMLGKRPPAVVTWMWCIVTPSIIVCILAMTVLGYPGPTFGTYRFPGWAQGVGWLIAVSSVLPIPLHMAWELWRRQGSFAQRLRDSLRPTASWRPQSAEHQELYAAKAGVDDDFTCPVSLPCLRCRRP